MPQARVGVGADARRAAPGGQCKRTNIGIALVANPRVLFLDEPTSGLDSYTANEVRRLQQHGLCAPFLHRRQQQSSGLTHCESHTPLAAARGPLHDGHHTLPRLLGRDNAVPGATRRRARRR